MGDGKGNNSRSSEFLNEMNEMEPRPIVNERDRARFDETGLDRDWPRLSESGRDGARQRAMPAVRSVSGEPRRGTTLATLLRFLRGREGGAVSGAVGWWVGGWGGGWAGPARKTCQPC